MNELLSVLGSGDLVKTGVTSILGVSVFGSVLFLLYKSLIVKTNPVKYLNLMFTCIDYLLIKIDSFIDSLKKERLTNEIGVDLQKTLLACIDDRIVSLKALRKKLED